MALRRRSNRAGLPDGWAQILEQRSAQWRLLAADERTRLGQLADWLLRDKRWEAARDFALTDEVRTLVSAHAALLILGLDESWYDEVGSIVVRAGSMTQRTGSAGPIRGTVNGSPQWIDGETHHSDGPLMVSWRTARRESNQLRIGRDVVLHEFAHKIDMRDGTLDGTPLLDDEDETATWIEVCTRHYEAVRAGTAGPLLRSYAGTNVGEFFAVATETFFTRSIDLAEHMPDLYAVFESFYRQDPAARVRAFIEAHQHETTGRLTLGAPRIVVRSRPPGRVGP